MHLAYNEIIHEIIHELVALNIHIKWTLRSRTQVNLFEFPAFTDLEPGETSRQEYRSPTVETVLTEKWFTIYANLVAGEKAASFWGIATVQIETFATFCEILSRNRATRMYFHDGMRDSWCNRRNRRRMTITVVLSSDRKVQRSWRLANSLLYENRWRSRTQR